MRLARLGLYPGYEWATGGTITAEGLVTAFGIGFAVGALVGGIANGLAEAGWFAAGEEAPEALDAAVPMTGDLTPLEYFDNLLDAMGVQQLRAEFEEFMSWSAQEAFGRGLLESFTLREATYQVVKWVAEGVIEEAVRGLYESMSSPSQGSPSSPQGTYVFGYLP